MFDMKKLSKLAAVTLSATLMFGSVAQAAGGGTKIPHQDWSFSGPFGVYEHASIQRGFQVFKEVCSSCHSLDLIAFRNLQDVGFSEAEVKAIAAESTVMAEPNEDGEVLERDAKPSDFWPGPFANEQEAVAAHGTMPPDLSLMAKARVGGPDYIYALLTGYAAPTADDHLHDDAPEEGKHNVYFPGHVLAMAQPLYDGQVDYVDGTPNTLDQMSKDVSHFLMWAAEPNLDQRKSMGIKVMLFLLALTFITFLAYRRVARRVKDDH
jgi:ubiquinol-cytochrome c reductase cytochrome c1 subunit